MRTRGGLGTRLGIDHAVVVRFVLLGLGTMWQKSLTVGSLLIGLHQRAAWAAEGCDEVLDAASLKVVLLADVLALHSRGDPVNTKA